MDLDVPHIIQNLAFSGNLLPQNMQYFRDLGRAPSVFMMEQFDLRFAVLFLAKNEFPTVLSNLGFDYMDLHIYTCFSAMRLGIALLQYWHYITALSGINCNVVSPLSSHLVCSSETEPLSAALLRFICDLLSSILRTLGGALGLLITDYHISICFSATLGPNHL